MRHPQSDEGKRADFTQQLQSYEQSNRPIIYLDESGFKSHDYRPYAYASRGQKCHDTYNWQLKNITNAIGAIHNGQLFSVGLYNCSINSHIFHHWVKTLLLPQLPQNSVIVMDNAAFHKRQDIQSLIEDAGHTILWLPPYSPDLNTIEATRAQLLPCAQAKRCFAYYSLRAWVKQKRKDWQLDCIDSLFFYFMWICTIY